MTVKLKNHWQKEFLAKLSPVMISTANRKEISGGESHNKPMFNKIRSLCLMDSLQLSFTEGAPWPRA